MRLFHRLTADVLPRTLWGLAALLAMLLAAPAVLGTYGLSVLILVLYFAYVGQAWNIMMGFAGQLSLGHALYAGIGGYVAAALFFHYGVSPWIGAFAAVAAAAAAGVVVGYLGFRFSLAGVYFALLTIAFAEFTRLAFDNWDWVGGSGGLFLKVDATVDVWNLRGGPVLFYYLILALAVFAFGLCRALLESRLGRYWLAIREDAEAAQAIGVPVLRCKMLAVLISAALTALAGVWGAFYYNNLFPEHRFRHGPLDRDHAGADHRRTGHAVRSCPGRRGADGPRRSLHRCCAAPCTSPASSRSSTASLCWSSSCSGPAGIWPWIADRLGFGERRR